MQLLRRFIAKAPSPPLLFARSSRRTGAVSSMAGAQGSNAVQNPAELVCVVDEHNRVTGSATRAEMRARNLIHR